MDSIHVCALADACLFGLHHKCVWHVYFNRLLRALFPSLFIRRFIFCGSSFFSPTNENPPKCDHRALNAIWLLIPLLLMFHLFNFQNKCKRWFTYKHCTVWMRVNGTALRARKTSFWHFSSDSRKSIGSTFRFIHCHYLNVAIRCVSIALSDRPPVRPCICAFVAMHSTKMYISTCDLSS